MIPVAFYVLRERSRPTEEEARSFLMSCVHQCEGVDLAWGGQLATHIANVMRPSEDLSKDFEAFIRQSGGEKYQGKPREYKWQFFEAETGDPPELTCLALVFALQGAKAKPMPPQPSVQEFLARGNRWEALGLWGNALLCFLIGQNLYPDDLDLKLRVGRAQSAAAESGRRGLPTVARSSRISPLRSGGSRRIGGVLSPHGRQPATGDSRFDAGRVARMGSNALGASSRPCS